MSAKNITPFDKKADFEENILPTLTDLVRRCTALNIPIYICAAVKNDENKTTYVQDGVSPFVAGLTLADDWYVKMLNVTLGFETIRKEDMTAFNRGEVYDDEQVRGSETGFEPDEYLDTAVFDDKKENDT